METIKDHHGKRSVSYTTPPVLLGVPVLLMMPSGGELFIIFFAVLLLFGGKKIPELMRGLGRGIREFNDARDGIKKTLDESIRQAEREAQELKRMATKDPAEGN
jgi:sec-independent protein translocase protein TatA